ncbi:Transcription termination factor 2 [Cytospora mali]|uniref:Transcription termination factor 2 n=1 Tax=Cytospora mali TaxID=578113 RepID=A0A194V7R5_CYTMA|nr:Transcription termination factor 2 [Valsa mali var. pyri (nom. inval.)]
MNCSLNLTVANQVHIVEPQWNPSVEEQAIARAVRMGQTGEVTIFRYVLQNTVEQNVVKLQEKKRGLAKFTLAGGDQSVSDTLQELEAVLDLKPRKRAASGI